MRELPNKSSAGDIPEHVKSIIQGSHFNSWWLVIFHCALAIFLKPDER